MAPCVALAVDDEPGQEDFGPDRKVLEFLRILDEYRLKCEEEGNYLEAGRAAKQLEALRKQVRAGAAAYATGRAPRP